MFFYCHHDHHDAGIQNDVISISEKKVGIFNSFQLQIWLSLCFFWGAQFKNPVHANGIINHECFHEQVVQGLFGGFLK